MRHYQKPMEHQISGARFIGQRTRSLLLDSPGLGKTRTAIMALDMRQKHFQQGMRGVVVCPAIARTNWVAEFKKWSRVPRRYVVGEDIHDIVAFERGTFDVLICSYEYITKWGGKFDEKMEWFDFIIMDEAHRIKAASSKRKMVLIGKDCDSGVASWANWGCMLTGTIMPNSAIDMYNPLCWARVIKSDRDSFTKRYFRTIPRRESDSHSPKKEAIPVLKAMIDKVAIRRSLEDAGIHLPPILFSNRILEGDRTEILEFLATQPDLSTEIYKAIDDGDLALLDSPHVATLRRLIGEAKALPFARMLLEEIRDGKTRGVIFGFHRKALQLINDHLAENGVRVAMLVGGMPRKQADEIIQGFEKDQSIDWLIANYKSAGEALTFVSARYLFNFERPWDPGSGEQVIKRVHRIGQSQTVVVQNITLDDSIDIHVNEVIDRKNNSIGELGHRMLIETGEKIVDSS